MSTKLKDYLEKWNKAHAVERTTPATRIERLQAERAKKFQPPPPPPGVSSPGEGDDDGSSDHQH